MKELIAIVEQLAERCAGFENSSLTYEKVQSLMEAVCYCVDEYRRSCSLDGPSDPLPADDSSLDVKAAYSLGYQLVVKKTVRLRELYNDLSVDFHDYGMECLRSTVLDGIPEFFKWYDARFAPQETLLTLDYPILEDLHSMSGVDAVYAYMVCICLEQKFLRALGEEYVRDVLTAYSVHYGVLIENICSIVLLDVVRHFFLNRPLVQAGFSGEDKEKLREQLKGKKKEEISLDVKAVIGTVVERLFEKDEELKDYLCREADNIAIRIAV